MTTLSFSPFMSLSCRGPLERNRYFYKKLFSFGTATHAQILLVLGRNQQTLVIGITQAGTNGEGTSLAVTGHGATVAFNLLIGVTTHTQHQPIAKTPTHGVIGVNGFTRTRFGVAVAEVEVHHHLQIQVDAAGLHVAERSSGLIGQVVAAQGGAVGHSGAASAGATTQ